MLHRILGALLLVFVGVLLAYKFTPPPSTAQSSSSLLRPIEEEKIRESITEGEQKITLVNLWASWCVPCRKEFPQLLALAKELGPDQMKLILISADEEDQRLQVERFLSEQGVDFPTYFKGNQDLGVLDHLYPNWNGALPASVIYSPKGEILEAWFGETTRAQFEELIKKHL